ncbi:hypothetical protein HOS59_gp31 [Streptomyces phage Rowa]|uniref:Uncharacterized protein n=1 Tax=Streptomyces phage Rowa TaxID=2059883 RepID=A0A2H5BM07_9CAUD|nr:hypothetical protein HOS59_gp31 [Streptomyces phage Rowa]AUG87295.1 hypothetical protein SEA_ROWA_31 [Streptomyces phage Rowa]
MKLKSAATVLLTALIFVGLFYGAGFVTMLIIGALHSAVPVIPAVSYMGALWIVILGMWFRVLFAGGSNTSK